MAKTLPTLTPTASVADNTILIVRRAGQTSDESALASVLKTLFNTAVAIDGGTMDDVVIGGSTPAAATVTDLTATGTTTLDTALTGVLKALAGVVSTGTVDLTSEVSGALSVANGGTGATDASGARTNLGVGASGTHADSYFAQTANNLSDLANAATARTNLGLGSIATQAASSVAITGGTITGITDLAVVDGGTGASNASGARTNLGLVIGTDVQAYNANLAALAGLTSAADTLPYFTGSGTAGTTALTTFARSLLDDTTSSAARTTLALGTIATQDASNVTITGGSISGITDLAVADGGTGASDASGARTNLGLGTIATQNANNVTISGGSITGIADLAVGDGGTGASTPSGARTNLGLVIGTDVQAYDVELAAIAGLTSAANKLPYFTGSGTAAVTDLSSFGRTLIDDADAATARATLEVGIGGGTNVSLSGTSTVLSTSIPSTAKKVTVILNNVSLSGTSFPKIQLGTSVSYVNSGYTSYACAAAPVNPYAFVTSSTSGFALSAGNATIAQFVKCEFTLLTGNTWVWSACGGTNNGSITFGISAGGSVSLGGVLTRAQILTDNGSETFDSGSATLFWE